MIKELLYIAAALSFVYVASVVAACGWHHVRARYQARFIRSLTTGDDDNG